MTQYRVDFEPDLVKFNVICNGFNLIQLFLYPQDVTQTRKSLINQNRVRFGGRYLFDGASIYLTQNREDFTIETTHDAKPMLITIRKTGSVDSTHPTAFQLFNLIFREAMVGLKLQNVRRDYFDPAAKIDVPQGRLELWPGYLTSIRAHENDVLMNAEISHKFMRKETIMDITRRHMQSDANNWRESLKREVIGTTVLTDYTNKTYMIDDIDFSMTPRSTFQPAFKEEPVTYMHYYETRYSLKIRDQDQFLLVSKATARDMRAGKTELIYLIPELCRATGMTDEMRNNFKLMQDLSAYTRLNPENRAKALKKFNNRIQQTPDSMKVLDEWNMKLDTDLISVPGRELPSETIVFGGSTQAPANPKGEWILGRGVTLHKPAEINRWIVIFPESMRSDTLKFLDALKKASLDMGCDIKDPMLKALESDKQDLYISAIKEFAPKKPKMILIVLPTNRADRYSAVKKSCLIDFGIPAQVVIKRTINHKSLGSIASKVAIQMNAKLGGLPWMIKLPVNSLMTVGFDVSHHPRDKSRSIGALVATMDLKKTGAFYSITSSYRDGNEMNIGLANHMKKALEIYRDTCGSLPEKILFYRDGVGDGQIQYVMKQEVDPLLAKLKEIYGDVEPKLAYIIVNKRTNTRVFKKSGSTVINVKPGTVVDREITLPDRNE